MNDNSQHTKEYTTMTTTSLTTGRSEARRPSRLVRQANWMTTLLLTTAVTSFGVFANSYVEHNEPVSFSEVSTSISDHALQLFGCVQVNRS